MAGSSAAARAVCWTSMSILKATSPWRSTKVSVKKGDVLTFAVTCNGNSSSDSSHWSPIIERIKPDGKMELLTDAKRDFCGADHWPMNRTKPQTPLSQLVQVLLMSNEFQFVE